MNTSRHLTNEALLLYSGGRLAPEQLAEAEEHLRICASCRQRSHDTRLAHDVLTTLSDMGLDEVKMRSGTSSPEKRFPAQLGVPLRTASIAACVAIFLGAVLFFSPRMITEVRASELLNKATARDTASPSVLYKLQVGTSACATLRNGSYVSAAVASGMCNKAITHLHRQTWSEHNPLSPKTFSAWRQSLARRRDRVDHRGSVWTVETSTDTGLLRSASLDLRETDYHPTGLTLRFDDDEELRVVETESSERNEPVVRTEEHAPNAPAILHTDDASDLLEVAAWQMLHELQADSGWEANVLRTGNEVSVRAVAATEDRKAELRKGLEGLNGARIQIETADEVSEAADFLPQRSFPAAGAALAESWVREQFSEPASQITYKNEVVRLSRNLLGRALFVERLEQRRNALASCSCANELSLLILSEQQNQKTLQSDLAARIAPLLETKALPVVNRPISAKSARQLDLLLQEMLISSDKPAESFDTERAELRSILGVNKIFLHSQSKMPHSISRAG